MMLGATMTMTRFALITALLIATFCMPGAASAQTDATTSMSSIVVDVIDEACMGQTRSREQTKKDAMELIKRRAAQQALSYVVSETTVLDGITEKDLVESYSEAEVRVLENLMGSWVTEDQGGGVQDTCYRMRIKAEVRPKEPKAASTPPPPAAATFPDPGAPLTVELWTEKSEYHVGETMKFYFRGNKPFYARAVYKDAQGHLVEITPSRDARYYQGGVAYEIPSPEDHFTLMITPPLGKETLTLYTSTVPINSYEGTANGPYYMLRDKDQDKVALKTRGLTVLQGTSNGGTSPAEFAETSVPVTTVKK